MKLATTIILILAFLAVCASWLWLMNDCVKARPPRAVVVMDYK